MLNYEKEIRKATGGRRDSYIRPFHIYSHHPNFNIVNEVGKNCCGFFNKIFYAHWLFPYDDLQKNAAAADDDDL